LALMRSQQRAPQWEPRHSTSVHLLALHFDRIVGLPWHVSGRWRYKKGTEWNVGLSCSNIEKLLISSVSVFMLVLGSHFSVGFPDCELPPTICHQCLLFINIISSSLRFPLPLLWSPHVSARLWAWQNLTVQSWEWNLK
jgi:hypothetical protein